MKLPIFIALLNSLASHTLLVTSKVLPEDGFDGIDSVRGRPSTGRWTTWTSWTTCSCQSKRQTRRRRCIGGGGGDFPIPRRDIFPRRPAFFDEEEDRVPRRLEPDGISSAPSPPRRRPPPDFLMIDRNCIGQSFQTQICTPSGCEGGSGGTTPPAGGLASGVVDGVTVYRVNNAVRVILTPEAKQYQKCVQSKTAGGAKRGKVQVSSAKSLRGSRVSCRGTVLKKKALAASLPDGASLKSKQVSGSSIAAKTTSTSCTNIPTFFNKLRSGLDASSIDFYSTSSNNGIENPIMHITCDFGSKIEIQGVMYNLPDQATSFYEVSVQELFADEGRIQTSSEVKTSLNNEVSMSGSFSDYFSFSASYSYKQMKTTLRQSDDYKYRFKYQAAAFVFPLDFDIAIDDPDSSGSAARFIRNRLSGKTYNTHANIYQSFVSIYGTHAMYRAKMGGVLDIGVSVSRSYTSTHTLTQTKKEVEISVLKFLKGKGASTSSTETNDQAFLSKSTLTARCFGGNSGGSCGSIQVPQWASSVPTSPHLLAAETLPLTVFIDDAGVRDNLDIAICRHLAVAYLQDVNDKLQSVLNLNLLQPSVRSLYQGLLNEGKDHLSKISSNSLASTHQSRCETIKNTFAPKVEAKLRFLREGTSQVVPLARVNYDQQMDQSCPADYFTGRIKSTYHDSYKDRQWDNQCARSSFDLFDTCQWTSNYVNNYKQKFSYACPGKGAISGLRSIHDGGRNEDRRWKFRCCQLSPEVRSHCSVTCSWTPNFTTIKGPMDFEASTDGSSYLAGVDTEVWHYVKRRFLRSRRYYTDRKWKFLICKVDSCT